MTQDNVDINPQQVSDGLAAYEAASGTLKSKWDSLSQQIDGVLLKAPWGTDEPGRGFNTSFVDNGHAKDFKGLGDKMVAAIAEVGTNVRKSVEASLAADKQQASEVGKVHVPSGSGSGGSGSSGGGSGSSGGGSGSSGGGSGSSGGGSGSSGGGSGSSGGGSGSSGGGGSAMSGSGGSASGSAGMTRGGASAQFVADGDRMTGLNGGQARIGPADQWADLEPGSARLAPGDHMTGLTGGQLNTDGQAYNLGDGGGGGSAAPASHDGGGAPAPSPDGGDASTAPVPHDAPAEHDHEGLAEKIHERIVQHLPDGIGQHLPDGLGQHLPDSPDFTTMQTQSHGSEGLQLTGVQGEEYLAGLQGADSVVDNPGITDATKEYLPQGDELSGGTTAPR